MPEQNNDFYIQRKLQIFVTFPYVTNNIHEKITRFWLAENSVVFPSHNAEKR